MVQRSVKWPAIWEADQSARYLASAAKFLQFYTCMTNAVEMVKLYHDYIQLCHKTAILQFYKETFASQAGHFYNNTYLWICQLE
jgi:hypothetical protein